MTRGASPEPRPTLDDARAALTRWFGYPDFRGGQTDAIRGAIEGRDVLVLMPTGGGKSLCYQVPALVLPGLTLVISPLISLMLDQVEALERRGVAAAFINSSLNAQEAAARMQAAEAGSLKMLYVAPERLDSQGFRERLDMLPIRLLAVDEAHCISQWGYDFRPSYLRVGAVRESLLCPVIALTATATPDVRRDIVRRLRLRDPVLVTKGFNRTNLSWHVMAAPTQSERQRLMLALLRRQRTGSVVVYASTRRVVDATADRINRAGLRAAGYHAGVAPSERERLQGAFMDGRTPIIVATNAFGMGVDKSDVRLVVHVAMPSNLEGYYQEAGRAGRDGNAADCVLLHAYGDRFTHEFFIAQTYPPRHAVEAAYAALARRIGAGPAAIDAETLAGATKGACNAKQVESVLRILGDAGIVRVVGREAADPWIRLVALPDRPPAGVPPEDIELLRLLAERLGRRAWRGTSVPLNALRPLFPEPDNAAAVLAALHEAGLLEFRPRSERMLIERLGDWQPAGLPIDWTMIDARRARELRRVDAVQAYAYTRGCRRGFVLRYFGDPDAMDRCTGCDNCLGPRASLLRDAAPPRGPGLSRRLRQAASSLKSRLL